MPNDGVGRRVIATPSGGSGDDDDGGGGGDCGDFGENVVVMIAVLMM